MLRVVELFGGIGACSKALTNLGIEHEIVDLVEIDRFAVASFNAVHGTNFEPQDITKWDKDIECDLIMHGSPCQDFSIAGKQAGGDKDSGTRSSLMYETLRIVGKLKPKYVIWENVKNLLSKKHRHNFDAYLEAMKNLGYKNYYQVLNAKDYGIPQNRERVFTVSILKNNLVYDDYNSNIRGDQDTIGTLTTNCGATAPRNGWKIIEQEPHFTFPSPIPLEKKLKDMLEKDVDEKYYITDAMMNYFTGVNQKPSKFPRKERFLANINRKDQERANSITTNPGQRPTDNFVAIPIKTANKLGYDLAVDGDGVDLAYPNSETRRGRVGHGVSKTITTGDGMGVLENCRLRKLTPKECWRLMGFDDIDVEKASKVNSNTQLYKQAGNSIVVKVLEAVFKSLLLGEK